MSNTDIKRRLCSRAKKILKIFLYSLLSILITFIAVFATLWFSSGGESNSYKEFRAEGLSLKEALPSSVKYIRKYISKKHTAPDSIMNFFKIQNEYLEFIKVSDGTFASDTSGKEVDTISSTYINPEDEIVLTMAFVGDIMWMRRIKDSYPDEQLKSYLSGFDIVIGNLETPIDTLQRVPSFWPDYVRYNSPPELLRLLRRESGTNIFTALSLANNHTLDMGVDGLKRTMDFLRSEGILYTGVTLSNNGQHDCSGAKSYLTIEKNGVKIGLYATSWGLNNPSLLQNKGVKLNTIPGLAPLNPSKIDISEPVKALREMDSDGVDFKIVYVHWGFEFEMYPDPEIMRVGRELAAAGADIVAGAHPHVVQPTEIVLGNGYSFLEDHKQRDVAALFENLDEKRIFYHFKDSSGKQRKSLIYYSLGNFTSAMFTEPCRVTAVQSVQLKKSGDFVPHSYLHIHNRN
jgi:poly-gamma-glutamate capsule biosynthesis protein CapA/YwtB (metallophosphatase superfamily)